MNVSIIIPTYNNVKVIIRSLETWTKQVTSFDKFEVIIVDNNSTDNTSEIIKNFIRKYTNFFYLLEPNAGATNARHLGAKNAKSDILVFADDDGLFNPNCINKIFEVYQNNKDVDAVAGKIDILWDIKPPEWITPYEFMLGKLDYGTKVIYGTDIYLNGGLFSIRKEVFYELGGFNPDLVGNYLVGDGDTGLVHKLHNANKLIGWTPYAIMQHLQFLNSHGTKKDMGRRFYNVGISNSYSLFRKNSFKWNQSVIRYLFISIIFLLKKQIEFKLTKRNNRKVFFSFMQKKGELAFFLQLRHQAIRKLIKKNLNKASN